MKYKVGDKVRIRQWKAIEREYGIYNKRGKIYATSSYMLTEEMKQYCGKVAIIKDIGDNWYELDIDNGKFYWADDMFEGYAFEYGEIAEFSSNGRDWVKGIYVNYIDGEKNPYCVVSRYYIDEYNDGKTFNTYIYKYARPLSKKHTIIIDGKEIEISEESYNNLKRSLDND